MSLSPAINPPNRSNSYSLRNITLLDEFQDGRGGTASPPRVCFVYMYSNQVRCLFKDCISIDCISMSNRKMPSENVPRYSGLNIGTYDI